MHNNSLQQKSKEERGVKEIVTSSLLLCKYKFTPLLHILNTKQNYSNKKNKMANKKPRIVIIGAGMAGLSAAHKLHRSSGELFDLRVVEGGDRIGGRINSSEFCGDRVELGATWIHGIQGSPVHAIAHENGLLHSNLPWECMDGFPEAPVTAAEGGHVIPPSTLLPISELFQNLMDSIHGKSYSSSSSLKLDVSSVGSFLRSGLEAYLEAEEEGGGDAIGKWRRKQLEAAVFSMHENTQRSYTAADDLCALDYEAERDYTMFPGENITIAQGYSSVVEWLASALPEGTLQLGQRVARIEWQRRSGFDDDDDNRPVRLHFCDGSTLSADHVIVTVSLGVLKRGIEIREGEDRNVFTFDPALPSSKIRAISRLGFGVVNKVFLQRGNDLPFPTLQMVFHHSDSGMMEPTIPHWIRKIYTLYPIYKNSRVVLSWFTGKEALEIESLSEDEIINGFSATLNNLLPDTLDLRLEKAIRTQWGSNPLFLGSYSYVAVGSTIADMDTLSEPLPEHDNNDDEERNSMQILFAGEATHSTHYSTTHGAYFSGLREANRLLQHYL